jgi:hypothetical protein
MTMIKQARQKELKGVPSPEITLAAYKQAEAELRIEEGRIGFSSHAIIYVLVNALLIVLNLLIVPGFLWFFYPLICWGIGLGLHYLFEVRWIGKVIEDREAKVEYRAKQALLRQANTTVEGVSELPLR